MTETTPDLVGHQLRVDPTVVLIEGLDKWPVDAVAVGVGVGQLIPKPLEDVLSDTDVLQKSAPTREVPIPTSEICPSP